MSIYVALLRGINVGGRKMIAMSDLRDLFAALELTDARSLLQSGNLVFQSQECTGAMLERLLEVETEKRLDVSIDYLVRSAEEWRTIIAGNPFPEAAERDPGHLLVLLVKEAPAAKAVRALQAAIQGPEVVRAKGKHVYLVYPEGIGRSKLTHTLIEKKLGTRGTGRNWNTVLKLAELMHV